MSGKTTLYLLVDKLIKEEFFASGASLSCRTWKHFITLHSELKQRNKEWEKYKLCRLANTDQRLSPANDPFTDLLSYDYEWVRSSNHVADAADTRYRTNILLEEKNIPYQPIILADEPSVRLLMLAAVPAPPPPSPYLLLLPQPLSLQVMNPTRLSHLSLLLMFGSSQLVPKTEDLAFRSSPFAAILAHSTLFVRITLSPARAAPSLSLVGKSKPDAVILAKSLSVGSLHSLNVRTMRSWLYLILILMATNRAAWQDKPGVRLQIRSTPYSSTLSPTQILVKSRAWAINPADPFIQDTAGVSFIIYPVILGEDTAGTVVSVGSAAAARFKHDDRVLAVATGSTLNVSEMGGFQEYVVAEAGLACHIPASMSFAEASVYPLALVTAVHALFSKDFLALPNPKVEPVRTGLSLLVGGGSSAVGSNAIQLATAAGFNVISSASPHSFSYVKSLGASQVFDYSSETVIPDVVAELDRSTCAGIFQAAESVEACLHIADKATTDLFVATALPVPEDKVPEGVRAKMVFGTTLTNNETGPAIFEDFLPKALAQGKYKVAPEPRTGTYFNSM
ncbi:MAG: hypothetical protein Q9181_003259 [Wetmoreana brouardii]